MIIRLKRFSYGEYETEGVFILGDLVLATIEQPWTPNPNGAAGGKPFESCVPDGTYNLKPFKRPSGEEAFILTNPKLGVHYWPGDHELGVGRDLCLIHAGNWASSVQGCIAPGVRRSPMADRKTEFPIDQAVASSSKAMKRVREKLGTGQHILSIENDTGAKDAN